MRRLLLTVSAAGLLPLAIVLGLARCGGGAQYKASGHVLSVADQNFNKADYYCDVLANGQYMVILTDFKLCGIDAGGNDRSIFHGAVDETNLRLVFPSANLKKVPDPNNVFQVGQVDCQNGAAAGTEATAWFSHSTPGQANYDVDAQATSGTITVHYPSNSAELNGSFDLLFGSDHVTGTFDATACKAIVPGFGS